MTLTRSAVDEYMNRFEEFGVAISGVAGLSQLSEQEQQLAVDRMLKENPLRDHAGGEIDRLNEQRRALAELMSQF